MHEILWNDLRMAQWWPTSFVGLAQCMVQRFGVSSLPQGPELQGISRGSAPNNDPTEATVTQWQTGSGSSVGSGSKPPVCTPAIGVRPLSQKARRSHSTLNLLH
jgi:hypothetical protein